MNPRSTGWLFLVALAVAAFVYFFEIRGGEERREREEQSARLFPDLEAQDVEAIWFYVGDGVTRVQREEGGWQLIAPVEFPGDAIVLDGIASGLSQLTRETVIESPQAPEVYGLGGKSMVVYFTAKGTEYGLRIGGKAPLGENQYVVPASLDPAERVYTVASWRVNAIQKDLDDIRDKRVLEFDREAVDQIAVTWKDGGVELQLVDDRWRVTSPVQDEADQSTVDRLLSDLAFMRAEGFRDDLPSDRESGLDKPVMRFDLRLGRGLEEGNEEEVPTRTLELGAPRGQKLLVRGAYASLYELNVNRLDDFPRRLVAYRDKTLASFDPSEAFAIELRFRDDELASEAVLVRLERDDEAWSGDSPVSSQRVDALVNELARLAGDDIVADQVGDTELEAFGFSPARVTLVVFGRKSEAGFGVRLAEVEMGLSSPERGLTARQPEGRKLLHLDWALADILPVSHRAFLEDFVASDADDNAGDDAVEALAPATDG